MHSGRKYVRIRTASSTRIAVRPVQRGRRRGEGEERSPPCARPGQRGSRKRRAQPVRKILPLEVKATLTTWRNGSNVVISHSKSQGHQVQVHYKTLFRPRRFTTFWIRLAQMTHKGPLSDLLVKGAMDPLHGVHDPPSRRPRLQYNGVATPLAGGTEKLDLVLLVPCASFARIFLSIGK